MGIASRKGAKHAKFGEKKYELYWGTFFKTIFRTLRLLRLCERYSEFRLRLCRAGNFVIS
jgi:hypothetical protein